MTLGIPPHLKSDTFQGWSYLERYWKPASHLPLLLQLIYGRDSSASCFGVIYAKRYGAHAERIWSAVNREGCLPSYIFLLTVKKKKMKSVSKMCNINKSADSGFLLLRSNTMTMATHLLVCLF